MKKTKISIITANYNSGDLLDSCLYSIACQKWRHIEHIIQDGLSEDDVQSKVSLYNKRVSYEVCFESQKDESYYDALNRGISKSTGEIVGWLNSDDIYENENVLSLVAEAFEDPKVDIVYGNLMYVKDRGCAEDSLKRAFGNNSIEDMMPFSKSMMYDANKVDVVRNWKSSVFTREKLMRGWMPPHPTIFVRKKIFSVDLLHYKIDFGTSADYEWIVRVFNSHGERSLYLNTCFVLMRTGGLSNSTFRARMRANRMDCMAWRINNLRPHPLIRILKPLRKLTQYI